MRAAPRGDTYEEKRAKARVEKLEAAQKENATALTTYGWVDKTKGVARIPIDGGDEIDRRRAGAKRNRRRRIRLPRPNQPPLPRPVRRHRPLPARAQHRPRTPSRHTGGAGDSGHIAEADRR